MSVIEQKIDDCFALWQGKDCPGGQVFVKQNGVTIYKKNFGYANIEHSVKITDDTVFHVASVSKQITVLSALLLAETGKLDLDADIRDYVPELILFDEPVSVRNLMNNVSGIRDQWELLMLRGVRIDDTITMNDLETAIGMQAALNFEPGSQYLYSNSNFTLLSEIVKRLSGKNLAEFAKENIFEKLGMGNTLILDDCTKIVKNRANSYDDNGEGKFSYHPLNYSVSGATSLNTTATDMMHVLENYTSPKICTQETVKTMMHCPKLADGTKSPYGAGLMLDSYKNHEYLEHGGVDAAYRAHVMSFYNDGLNIVILSNTQNTIPSIMARKIADIVLDLPNMPSSTQKYFNAAKIEPKTGKYYATQPDAVMFNICSKGSKLYLGNSENAPELHNINGNCYQIGYTSDCFYFGEKPCMKMGAHDYELNLAEENAENTEFLLQFEGVYESDEVETCYYITEEDGYLLAAHVRHGKTRLIKTGKDQYMMCLGEVTSVLNFERGSGNRILGFTLDCGRVKHLGFTKKEA